MRPGFVLLLTLAALAAAFPLRHQNNGKLTVRLQVFSGTANPEWTISYPATTTVSCNAVLRTYYPVVGYRGFIVTDSSTGKETEVLGCLELEGELLLGGIQSGAINAQVQKYVESQLSRLAALDTTKVGPHADYSMHFGSSVPAPLEFTPIVGPDTVPAYDPQKDDQGGFVTYCSDNNCYDYGTDIVTNTFAQPGRGSGQKWIENTCENINASAIRDGLEWIGTELPTAAPSVGHYVALLVWPDTNFHWVRMDSNKMWSHKPGGTPVRNTDNNGEPISDPSKADISPWTQFCGYMHVVPSKIKIN